MGSSALSVAGGIAGGMIGGPAGAAAGSAIGGAIGGSGAASGASSSASGYQYDAAARQIAEQRRQFDEVQKLLKPYVDQGASAIGAQGNLIGLGSPEDQQKAIYNLAYGPQMEAMVQQGENALLQNAAATGGLRGGNTQAALAQFRPQLLNQLINQQFANLGGLSSIGANAAASQANAGMQSSAAIQQAMGQQGAALAGNALAQGQYQSNFASSMGGLGGMIGSYFGSPSTASMSSNIMGNLF